MWAPDASPAELAQIATAVRAGKVGLCSITEDLDSTALRGEQLSDAIAAIARLQERATGGGRARRVTARSDGARGGRPRLLDEPAHAAVRALYDAREHTIDEIAALHGVSRPTVYRSLKRTRAVSEVTVHSANS